MKWINLLIILFLVTSTGIKAQASFLQSDYSLLENRYYEKIYRANADTINDENGNNEFPSPKSVMFKSMLIPGWGQIENGQIWKVPIVYGLFAGVGIYTNYLHQQYKDYRAAFYNTTQGEESDFRFGPTPEHLEGLNANQLQSTRNSFRNQRDFMFVVFGLAYGLNALDAYVYAHMRSFDVSDDLSARTTVQPTILAEGTPGLKISLSLLKK